MYSNILDEKDGLIRRKNHLPGFHPPSYSPYSAVGSQHSQYELTFPHYFMEKTKSSDSWIYTMGKLRAPIAFCEGITVSLWFWIQIGSLWE